MTDSYPDRVSDPCADPTRLAAGCGSDSGVIRRPNPDLGCGESGTARDDVVVPEVWFLSVLTA